MRVVAEALNSGDIALAQTAALLLKLPEPVGPDCSPESRVDLAARLFHGGWLRKDWDPDKHPRTGQPPNPGWFAPSNATGGERPATGETQVAVLTRSFKYACRVLRLDPNKATDALHAAKRKHGLGGADNCRFDTETGDIIFNGESIGNLGD